MPYFEPPIVYDNPPTLPGTRGVINSYAKWQKGQRRGRSVLKNAGVYTVIDTPTVDQTKAADIYYAGGHIYEISDAEAAALIAAGFKIILGLPGHILIETSGDFITTQDGEPITDESGTPLGWDFLLTTPSVADGVLLDEAGNRLVSEYVL